MGSLVIRKSTYKGMPSLIIENSFLRAVILPRRGGKIASLALKPAGGTLLESFWEPPVETYGYTPAYGDTFGSEDGGGYDDMFPSISAYCPSDGPWKGVSFPDHGELWAIPWTCTSLEDGLTCSVHALRMPCTLERNISLQENKLALSYRLKNHSTFTIPFQWAAHPIFRVSPGSDIIIPPGMDSIINAYDGKRLGGFGTSYSFPFPEKSEKNDLRRIPDREMSDCQKYWFTDPVEEGYCGVKDRSTGLVTTIRFDPVKTPYLGVWVNAGGWNNSYNVGLEPSTCIMDDPEAAQEYDSASYLYPQEIRTWKISIELDIYR